MKLIIVGYGWSGSSAIIDYLYDKGLVCGFFMEYPGEAKILSNRIPLYLKELNNKFNVSDYNIYDFVALISAGRYGMNLALNRKYHEEFFKNKPNYFGNQINIEESILIDIIRNSVGEKEITVNEVVKSYNLIVDGLLNELETNQSKLVVFNNDAHIYRNDSFYDLTGIHKIIVFRNPLDQFTDRYIFSPGQNTSPNRTRNLFRFILVHNIKLLITIYKTLIDDKLRLISFERFLFDENERERLFQSLNQASVANVESERIKRFEVEKSKKNVGLYKTRLTLLEVTLIYVFAWPLYKFVSKLY